MYIPSDIQSSDAEIFFKKNIFFKRKLKKLEIFSIFNIFFITFLLSGLKLRKKHSEPLKHFSNKIFWLCDN